MVKHEREQNIKKIISLEDRITNCNRCGSTLQCVRKPSLGKGDLQPEALLIFESDNTLPGELKKFLKIRSTILNEFDLKRIYHTFLVRCQPKACPHISNAFCLGDYKLINQDHNCILTNKQCNGTTIKPDDEQIIACLPYLIEEIGILNPSYLFMFGDRVANFVLKSWGLFEEYQLPSVHSYNELNIFIVDEEHFTANYCKELKSLANG